MSMSCRMATSCSSSSMSDPEGIETGFAPAGAVGVSCFTESYNSAKLLILGSFPSLQSQAKGQYYGHERNHFWRLVCEFAGIIPPPAEYDHRLNIAADFGIVIWDMIASCRRRSSADDALEIVSLNDIESLLARYPLVSRIGLNGTLASRLFLNAIVCKPASLLPQAGSMIVEELAGRRCEIFRLPSTSPVPSSRFRTYEDRRDLWFQFLAVR